MAESVTLHKKTGYPPEFEKLAEFIKDLQFGSVIIQIENGRIIQMDRTEKYRFDKQKK